MNLEESDAFVEEMEKNDKKKKSVLTIIISCGVLIVVLLIFIMYLTALDAKTFKFFIDGNKIQNYYSIIFDKNSGQQGVEPDYYINIEQFAKTLGYSYQKGEYKSYTEDPKSCYITTPYEIVSMKADSDGYTKYIINSASEEEDIKDEEEDSNKIKVVVKSKNETQKTFHIDNPIQYIESDKYPNVKEGLYVPIEEMIHIFNVQIDTSEKNRVRIISLDNLINNYATKIATNYKYKTVSNSYENFTAMADGMLVVGDGTNYGVFSLATKKEIISLKYEDIVYMQNTQEFQVSAEGSVGVISQNGETIIKPTEYDNISVLDEKKKVYLVEKNDKYGVVNNTGDTIIFCDYDFIGIPNPQAYSKSGIRNYNLLFDNCIPVELNGKFGLMDLEGNEILKTVYDSLGTADIETDLNKEDEENENSNNSNNANNTNTANNSNITSKNSKTKTSGNDVLIIPEDKGIKGIVLRKDNLFGIFDAEVNNIIIPCVFSEISSKTVSGKTNYTLVDYNGEEIDLDYHLSNEHLISIENAPKKDEEKTNEDDEENIETNNEATLNSDEEKLEEDVLEEEDE